MKTKKEFYQVKIKIYHENYNVMRGIETNYLDEAEKRFFDMEKIMKDKNSEWILQLNKVYKNNVATVRVSSSSGYSLKSPLY